MAAGCSAVAWGQSCDDVVTVFSTAPAAARRMPVPRSPTISVR
jgi:hypothetical protein